MSIAIIGLGAIGGSLALDLSASMEVVGYDVDPKTVKRMRAAGIDAHPWSSACADADIIVIAVPLGAALEVLRTVAHSGAIITDVCSTKRQIVAYARELGCEQFVGGHPFAGTHESGGAAARGGMFQGHAVFLTRQEAPLEAMWQRVGAQIVVLDAEEHDRRMAWLSHLPQLTANALALTLHSAEFTRDQLGPGGRDMTRLAGSDVAMWKDIVTANADLLDQPLAFLIEALTEMRSHLHRSGALPPELFRASREWFEG